MLFVHYNYKSSNKNVDDNINNNEKFKVDILFVEALLNNSLKSFVSSSSSKLGEFPKDCVPFWFISLMELLDVLLLLLDNFLCFDKPTVLVADL